MTEAPLVFELDAFEYLPATAGTALVRLSGTWRSGGVTEPALVVRTPFGDDRVEPLPGPGGDPAPDQEWRAAFSVALHVITGGTASFALDGGDGLVDLPAPAERGEPGGFDRIAAGRELGELRAANEGLAGRVQELERELKAAREELRPRQARAVAKAKERAQQQVAEAQLAARMAQAQLEQVTKERERLERRLEELAQEGGSVRGAHGVLQSELDELRAERDNLRQELAAARKQAGEGARQAEHNLRHAQEAERLAAEAEAKLETAARRLAEVEARAQEAEARAAQADTALEYARAAVAAAVASEPGDPRAEAALAEARSEVEEARAEAARLRGELDAVKVASAERLELAEARANDAIGAAQAESERAETRAREAEARAEAAEARARQADEPAQEAAARAEEARAEAARLRGELDAVNRGAAADRERLTERLAEQTRLLEESGDAHKRELARLEVEHERRKTELSQLKRRAIRAEREAEEAIKARDRALEDAKRNARRPNVGQRERPQRPPRRPTPAPLPRETVAEIGPPLAERLAAARREEADARDALERLREQGVEHDGPPLELVDAESAVDRAVAEIASLEEQLAAARENVERTAKSQLKRSSRGALKGATDQLATSLAEGEEVLHLTAGGQRDARRLVAATDRRLLVVEGSENGAEAVGYDEVESVQSVGRGTLQVSTVRGQFQVENVAGDLTGLVQHVNQKVWDLLHEAGEAARPAEDES